MFTTWRIVRPLRACLALFARFVERGGDRMVGIFKEVGGRSNEPTKIRRVEKKKVMHARICAKFTIWLG